MSVQAVSRASAIPDAVTAPARLQKGQLRATRIPASRSVLKNSASAGPDRAGRASVLLRNLAEGLAGRERLQADQSRVFHRGLAVLDRLAVNRIADHLDEGRDAG